MGDQYDAPNQQAVRADGSAPWDEGMGGGSAPEPEPKAKTKAKADAEADETEGSPDEAA
jgi:hypothetical protein